MDPDAGASRDSISVDAAPSKQGDSNHYQEDAPLQRRRPEQAPHSEQDNDDPDDDNLIVLVDPEETPSPSEVDLIRFDSVETIENVGDNNHNNPPTNSSSSSPLHLHPEHPGLSSTAVPPPPSTNAPPLPTSDPSAQGSTPTTSTTRVESIPPPQDTPPIPVAAASATTSVASKPDESAAASSSNRNDTNTKEDDTSTTTNSSEFMVENRSFRRRSLLMRSSDRSNTTNGSQRRGTMETLEEPSSLRFSMSDATLAVDATPEDHAPELSSSSSTAAGRSVSDSVLPPPQRRLSKSRRRRSSHDSQQHGADDGLTETISFYTPNHTNHNLSMDFLHESPSLRQRRHRRSLYSNRAHGASLTSQHSAGSSGDASSMSALSTTLPSSPRSSMIVPEVTLVRSSLETQKKKKLASALSSMNRLKFESLGLIGRNREKQVLLDCLHRMNQQTSSNHNSAWDPNTKPSASSSSSSTSPPPPPRELVLLSGPSGAGKSSLAATLKDPTRRLRRPQPQRQSASYHLSSSSSTNAGAYVPPSSSGGGSVSSSSSSSLSSTFGSGIFVTGKHDIKVKDQPLAGIGIACNELCRHVLYGSTTGISKEDRLQHLIALRHELLLTIDKPLLNLLDHLIPLLYVILTIRDTSIPEEGGGGSDQPAEISRKSTKRTSFVQTTRRDMRRSIKAMKQRPSFTAQGGLGSGTGVGTTNGLVGGGGRKRRLRSSVSRFHHDAAQVQNLLLEEEDQQPAGILMGGLRVWESETSQDSNHENPTESTPKVEIDASQAKSLLQFAMRNFLRVMAGRLGPIVMLLDDLQWADQSSLDMIKAIVSDIAIPNILIIGCYRSDEVDDTHPLRRAIPEYQAAAAPGSSGNRSNTATRDFTFTELEIGNLPQESVNEMLVELLSVTPEKAEGLAKVCYKRTLGNVFFVKEFLMLLHEIDILVFDVGSFQWSWDEGKLEKETAATFNVVNMIKMKIDKYPDGMVLLLSVAASLGNIFHTATLKLLWLYLQDKYNGTSEGVDELLDVAQREMLIEPIGESSYRFVHDTVQETALMLMPDDESSDFRCEIGKCLYETLPQKELDNMLFVVTDLLNDGMYDGVEMGELNASAAMKARDLSAFNTSIHYVEKGILCLNRTDMWEEHPKLTMSLYTTGAEAEECAGNSEKSDWYCREVRRQEIIPVLDKMRVNNTIVERLYSNGKYDELWSIFLDTLDELGCTLPRRRTMQKFSALVTIRETKRKYLPVAEEVENMSMITDPAKREAIAFMLKAASFCLDSKNKPLYVLLCCKCVRWTKKYGLTPYTASGFASFANVLMHEYGDWKTAMKIGEIALNIEKRLGSNFTKASTLQKLSSFVLGWVKPLRTCRTNYLEAYRVGILSGNIGGAAMSILFFSICEFFSGGHKLPDLDEDLRNYISQLEKLKLHPHVLGLRLLWQKVLNLMGAPYNQQTTTLTGTAMHGIDVERHMVIYKTNSSLHICNLCAYFSEYEKGADVAMAFGDEFYKIWSGAAYFGKEPFSRALCLYATAIKTGQARYLKAARKARSTIAKWVRSGAINLVHELLILDAEEAVVKQLKKQIGKAYKQAISAAARGGFLQDAGIANERYATYLMSQDMLGDAGFYMKKAVQYYTDWGAARKVELLEQKYGEILNMTESVLQLDSSDLRVSTSFT